MKILSLGFYACILLSCNYAAKEEGIKKISREEAVADIEFMVDYIHGTHPDMFAEYPEEDFRSQVEEVKAALPDSIGLLEFYKRAGTLAPLLGDGHTGLGAERLFTQMEDREVFPYYAKLDPQRSWIFLPETGWEVISVNGIPSKTIVENMIRYASGESPAFRMVRIEGHFPYYMKMLYPAKKYRITYRIAGSEKVLTETVYPVVVDPPTGKSLSRYDAPTPYSYSIREDISTAILEFNSFHDTEKFSALLEEMFAEMDGKSIENLIIDLRRNGGGNSELGDELFQYISPVPFAQYGDVTVRISPNLHAAYPGIDGADSVYHYKTSGDDLQGLRDNPLRYAGKGNVYLLTSSGTFSSATDFAWAFQYFGMGTIVGEETGGHIVCFGDVIGTDLPHSGLRVFCSWKKFYGYGATEENTHPVMPDYPVPSDQALEFTIEHLVKGS